MVPEEKQQQCLVYTCITHLHFKSSMFATAEIFLLPSSNSALPLRKSGRQRSGRKKKPNRLNQDMGILIRSRWQRLPPYPLLTMQNQSCSGCWPDCVLPKLLHRTSHGLHEGHGLWAPREIHLHPTPPPQPPAVPSLHPPFWPVSSGTLQEG